MWINSKTQNDWCVQLLISVIPCYYLHRSHSHGLEIQVEVLTVGLASWNTKNIKVTQKEDRINNEFVRGGGKKKNLKCKPSPMLSETQMTLQYRTDKR